MSSRTVQPETRTIPISNGDWILVKRRLNAGEHRAMVRRGDADRYAFGLAEITTYLVDWSLQGLPIRDKAIPDIAAAVDAIDPETYTEILRAIEKHIDEMKAERDAEKNAQAGERTSSGTSPSLVEPAGPSTMSAV